MMLGAPSTVSSLTSSSSDSSASDSIRASPLPIPDLVISSELPYILEMPGGSSDCVA
jgi:hypothetical protein